MKLDRLNEYVLATTVVVIGIVVMRSPAADGPHHRR